jgi:hypothetical protein
MEEFFSRKSKCRRNPIWKIFVNFFSKICHDLSMDLGLKNDDKKQKIIISNLQFQNGRPIQDGANF